MMEMRKRHRTSPEDQLFVRKYCFARSYPASDVRCPFAKAKIIVKPNKISSDDRKAEEVDADINMPLHEARLTSELDKCPNMERRKMIDTLYDGGG